MEKQFKDLNVGEQFVYNSISYTRIEDERVSCCHVKNAINNQTQEKVMVTPLENVTVQN
jgi:hypothetical protein